MTKYSIAQLSLALWVSGTLEKTEPIELDFEKLDLTIEAIYNAWLAGEFVDLGSGSRQLSIGHNQPPHE